MAWTPTSRTWGKGSKFLESDDPADLAPWLPEGSVAPRPGFDYLCKDDPAIIRCLGFLWERAPPRFSRVHVVCADVASGNEGEIYLEDWLGMLREHPRHAAEAEEAELLAGLPAGRKGKPGGI